MDLVTDAIEELESTLGFGEEWIVCCSQIVVAWCQELDADLTPLARACLRSAFDYWHGTERMQDTLVPCRHALWTELGRQDRWSDPRWRAGRAVVCALYPKSPSEHGFDAVMIVLDVCRAAGVADDHLLALVGEQRPKP
jgi:hypothetical protein